MKILVVGAGPAGLSFANLMAEADRAHEITVLERNAAYVRPGFGITLHNDAISFLRLDKAVPFQRLEGRAFRRRGEFIVDLPNPPQAHLVTFSREELINVLIKQCSRLGIRLRYENNVVQLREADLADFDLVVAADGANSAIRRLFEHAFAPTIEYARNRYAWFGVASPVCKLTVMLHDEGGAILGWAYKYTDSLSTLIVECSAAAFDNYNFAALSCRDAVAKVGQIFAREFRDEAVFCGDAVSWSRFPKISCARLFYRNAVLIGDAAHTTHFSQGFGTMFAFDDALALCRALTSTRKIPAALEAYECEQRPKIAEFQQTSFQSMRWSEMLMEAAESGDETRLNLLIASRWPNNEITSSPLSLRSTAAVPQ
jgi:2-polyprenyl-6-methoxyphenol hydroxylase-like FAD-dependent oxidoreductase